MINELRVIGALGITNSCSINIYEIDHLEDKVLAGLNNQTPEWCDIDYSGATPCIKWGAILFSLSEFIKVS